MFKLSGPRNHTDKAGKFNGCLAKARLLLKDQRSFYHFCLSQCLRGKNRRICPCFSVLSVD